MPDEIVQISAEELARLRAFEARANSAHERLRVTLSRTSRNKAALTLYMPFLRELIEEWDAKFPPGGIH